jgi:hypothetical protein
MSTKKVFIIYCEQNANLAEQFAADFLKADIEAVLDNRLPGPTGPHFEDVLAEPSQPVVLLLTDNFFKSPECMDHLGEFIRAAEAQLIPVIAEGRYPQADGGYNIVSTAFTTINEVMHSLRP